MGLLGMIAGGIAGRAETNRANKTEKGMAEQQYQNQRRLNQQGADLQMDMWNKTNYGAQLKHMQDAGLNPALMYGMGGGGGTTTGSQGGGSASKGNAQRQMGIEGAMAEAQIKLMKAQGEKAGAEADNIRGVEGTQGAQNIVESIARTSGIDAQKAKTIQETLNLKTLDQWNKVKADLDELKRSKNVTGSQITDLLSNLGLDPVNNEADRQTFSLLIGSYLGANMISKVMGSLKGLGKKGGITINN